MDPEDNDCAPKIVLVEESSCESLQDIVICEEGDACCCDDDNDTNHNNTSLESRRASPRVRSNRNNNLRKMAKKKEITKACSLRKSSTMLNGARRYKPYLSFKQKFRSMKRCRTSLKRSLRHSHAEPFVIIDPKASFKRSRSNNNNNHKSNNNNMISSEEDASMSDRMKSKSKKISRIRRFRRFRRKPSTSSLFRKSRTHTKKEG